MEDFATTLASEGVTSGKGCFTLSEPFKVIKKGITKRIQESEAYASTFIEQFQDFIGNDLKPILVPWKETSDENISATALNCTHSGPQSLLQLLCTLEDIQPQILQSCLEKLPVMEENDIDTAKLLLNQIRWLEFVLRPEELLTSMMECLPVVSVESLQREMILVLPEMIVDEQTAEVAEVLLSMMTSDESSLAVSILDTLGSFNLSSEMLSNVTEQVLMTLVSCNIEDLPAMLKFLIQSATPDSMDTIIGELRGKLNINSLGNSESTNESVSNVKALIVDVLMQGLRFREDFVKAFLLAITKSKVEYKVIDIWVLLSTYVISHNKKNVTTLLRKKLEGGQFTRKLLVESIAGHQKALQRSLFPALLDLAGNFSRVTDSASAAVSTGSFLYELLFDTFSEANNIGCQSSFYRQEIIGRLITHCGSGVAAEVDAALVAMVSLVQDQSSYTGLTMLSSSSSSRALAMQPYLPFLNQLLDYVEAFTDDQIRKVYHILSTIVTSGDGQGHNGVMAADELKTIINKQLGHDDIFYRRLGIIGALKMMEAETRLLVSNVSQESSVLDDDVASEVTEMLSSLQRDCRRSVECHVFLLQELTRSVMSGRLDSLVVSHFSESFKGQLEQIYLRDYDASNAEVYKRPYVGASLRSAIWMNLDGENSPLYVRIMEMVVSQEKDLLKLLCPLMKLIAISDQTVFGNLTGIDALIGAPLLLVDESAFDTMASKPVASQEVASTTLWYSINWCRTLVNNYSSQTDLGIQAKVVKRLHNLFELESHLEEVLEGYPSFVPPGSDVKISNSTVTTMDKKKKSQASSSISNTLDQMKASYITLQPIVVQVLAFENDIQLELPVVNVLFDVLISSLQKAFVVKKKIPFFAAAAASSQASKKKSGDVQKSYSPEALIETLGCSVFEAAKKYAMLYIGKLKEATGSGDSSIAVDKDDKLLQISIVKSYYEAIELLASCKSLQKTQRGRDAQLKSLRACISEDITATTNTSIEDLFQDLTVHRGEIFQLENLDLSLAYLKTLESLVSLNKVKNGSRSVLYFSNDEPNNEIEPKLSEIAHSYLQHDWSFGDKKFRYKTSNLQLFVQVYLSNAPLPLDAVNTLAIHGLESLVDNHGLVSSSYPTLTKTSVDLYYRPLLNVTVNCIATLNFTIGVNNPKFMLLYMNQATLLLKLLVLMTKTFQKESMVASTLKSGRVFIETIIKSMPFFKRHFREFTHDITDLFKDIQAITRRLQTLCAHGKAEKNNVAFSHVPIIKKLLETLIYSVEEIVSSHGAHAVYSTGVLKNRCIDGSVHQEPIVESSESESSESATETEEEEENDDADK